MMGGVSPETRWASYKYEIKFWYTVASCWIFFVSYTMMHGSTNIKFTIRMKIMKAYFYLVYRHQYYTLVAWIAQLPAANRLRNGSPKNLGSIPDDDNNCISSPNRPGRFWRPPSLLFNGCRGISLLVEKRPRHETAHSAPYNANVMNGWSRTSTFLNAFQSCTVTTLPYYCMSKALQNFLISINAVTNICDVFHNVFNTSEVMCWNQKETTVSNRSRLIC